MERIPRKRERPYIHLTSPKAFIPRWREQNKILYIHVGHCLAIIKYFQQFKTCIERRRNVHMYKWRRHTREEKCTYVQMEKTHTKGEMYIHMCKCANGEDTRERRNVHMCKCANVEDTRERKWRTRKKRHRAEVN
jgi:hypothetical protein